MSVPAPTLHQQQQQYSPPQQEPRIVNGRVVQAKRNNAHSSLPDALMEFRARRQRRTALATCTGGAMGLFTTGGPLAAVICAVGAFAVATTVAKHRECRILEQCLYSMLDSSGNKSDEGSQTLKLAPDQKAILAPTYENESEEESDEEDEALAKKRSSKKACKNPKRAMSAFFLYSQAHRTCVKDENPDATFGEIARILVRQFKKLPEEVVRKWATKAQVDEMRYQEERKNDVPVPVNDSDGKKLKNAQTYPMAPRINMSAYFLYSIAVRPSVKEEYPEASFCELARIIAACFKALGDKERKVWDDKAAADKDRYHAEMEAYKVSIAPRRPMGCVHKLWHYHSSSRSSLA
jgi:HMG (high mobility group) box